ncbi:MAG: hypothetical protein IPM17_00165 [Verrucomicrobia bacterium]|jgi:uncharacterized membrane protein|nr:hypothetical protein [Verrucomicrobiota bacterium]
MSLKAFHVVFLISAIALCLGFGAWQVRVFLEDRGWLDLVLAAASLLGGVALIVYFRAMLRKLRDFSYL